MIATPSVEGGLFRAGCMALCLVLLLTAPAFWLAARATMYEGLDERLSARIDFAMLYERERTPFELRDVFDDYGIIAEVVTPDGEILKATPVTGELAYLDLPPLDERFQLTRFRSAQAQWDDGTTITVFVSQSRTNGVLLRLMALLAGITAVAFAIGALLIRRAGRRVLKPINEIGALAERIAAGESGLRINPSDPSTPLGKVATLADQILDHSETTVARMQVAEAQTRALLDNAAHQLRSPIAAVQATVDALLYEERPEVRDRLRANLYRESERSGTLVEGLLRLAQIEQAQAVQHGYTNLGLVCRGAVERARTLAKDLMVEYAIENCARGIWVLDERAIREIVANLVENACRHAVSRVEVRATPLVNGSSGIRITVRDDGPGVPLDQREKIFERFVSFGSHRGSGLGLAVAQGLAQALGGGIVCNRSEFVVDLPAVRVGPEPLTPSQMTHVNDRQLGFLVCLHLRHCPVLDAMFRLKHDFIANAQVRKFKEGAFALGARVDVTCDDGCVSVTWPDVREGVPPDFTRIVGDLHAAVGIDADGTNCRRARREVNGRRRGAGGVGDRRR